MFFVFVMLKSKSIHAIYSSIFIRASMHSAVRRLTTRSREVSKPRDSGLGLFQSLLNMKGPSAAALLRCPSNFRAIRLLLHTLSRLLDIETRFGSKTSYHIANRGLGLVHWTEIIIWMSVLYLKLKPVWSRGDELKRSWNRRKSIVLPLLLCHWCNSWKTTAHSAKNSWTMELFLYKSIYSIALLYPKAACMYGVCKCSIQTDIWRFSHVHVGESKQHSCIYNHLQKVGGCTR